MSQLDARGLPEGYPFNAEWEVTPREFRRRRDAGESMVLVDVRTAAERATACIAGSVHLPLNEIESRADELRAHDDRPIVIHCHHGVRSLRAAASLRRLGFDQVLSLAGGIHLWSMDVDPSVPIY
jgi:rhodanese-related sulfurtransferase